MVIKNVAIRKKSDEIQSTQSNDVPRNIKTIKRLLPIVSITYL